VTFSYEEVKDMTRKILTVLLAVAVVMAFTLSTFADDAVKGKIEAFDKNARRLPSATSIH
jgi:hypothetical protein